MFRFFLLISSFLFAFSAESNLRGSITSSSKDSWPEFNGFLEKFSKKYQTLEEFETRFQIFKANLKDIVAHNSVAGQNFTMGVNQFTDLTSQEFKDL